MLESLKTGGNPVRFLASVTSVAEAEICVAGGADIIDCKNPAQGALGALDPMTVTAVRAAVPSHIPVSATIGDRPCDPETVARAVEEMAASTVDIVKIGCFPEGDPLAMIARVGDLRLPRARLVGVILVDLMRNPRAVDALIAAMARARFAGAMFDTARKAVARLPDILTQADMDRLIGTARRAGLFVGLAGALRVTDIAQLRARRPDLLGFRGALCRGLARESAVDPAAVARVAAALSREEAQGYAPPTLAETEL